MPTITEDYCSQEVYRLLREKGFDEEVHTTFDKEGYTQPSITLQMAMKWLRIEHNIHIEPHIVRTKCSYGYMPNYVDLKELKQHFPFNEFDFSNADKYVCITYDKACEVAIKYCLEHLI
jgi:hypothetical protein